ncbi:GntR family transcriptional regulator [Pseudorhodoferax sp.]|uniref:GntR family transcriptional regulator n=1 Tax=Pseudorhodoferax sp. TaxID=1993553 RepID=UPI0039E67F94
MARKSATPLRIVEPARAGREAPSTTDQIVESITNAIVEQRLMPGTKLVEQQIADVFAVSRTVVRQALNQLARSRLVTLLPARGAFVSTVSAEEARQVFELRRLVEGGMARELAARITDAQVAELRAHLREEQDAVRRGDVTGRTRLLTDFHVVLARLLGNDVLAELISDLLSRSQLIQLMYQSGHSAEHSQTEHIEIVDALARRDGRTAGRLMEQHISSVERNLRMDPRTPDLAAVLRPARKTMNETT